ncbi:MAG: hypothetical protein IKO74_04355 [Selenomonadaceae bacterium]|nr:hypothetical protein [Selenomonadaceae bacterium]
METIFTITLSYAANLSAVNITSSVQDIHPIYFVENYSVNDTMISATAYRDSINNYGSIISADRSDTVFNDTDNVYITTGDGFDYIYNDGSNSSIDAGAGVDYINAVASFVISGDGNDTLIGIGSSGTLDGGAGNDTNLVGGSNTSVRGGTGNDFIKLIYQSSDNIIVCNSGEGNDTIENFNENTTLSIDDSDTYFAGVSGKDIIVTVGEGSILLKDAASLASVNIVGRKLEEKVINIVAGENSIARAGRHY